MNVNDFPSHTILHGPPVPPRWAARAIAKANIKGDFNPEALHEYTDTAGTPLYWRIRARSGNGEKWIRPMRRQGMVYELGEPDFAGALKPLYRLHEVAAARPAQSIWYVEGEKKADELVKLGILATTAGGAQSDGNTDYSPLRDRTVILAPDNDAPGSEHMQRVTAQLLAHGCKVECVAIGALGLAEHGDIADWLALHPNATEADLLALPRISERQPQQHGNSEPPSEMPESDGLLPVSRLAALSPLDYELVRVREAKVLGARLEVLDKEVAAHRGRQGSESDTAGLFPPVAPWPTAVDGAELLDQIEDVIRRFVVCDEKTVTAAALWIAFTWFIENVKVAPIVLITAPEMRCGKTIFLDLMGRLVRRPLASSNISPAAVYRVIEAHAPTLLVDEADAFLRENEELRGVINSGHTKAAAYVIRNVGDNHEPRQFSTWAAKAIAGIGKVQPTIMDRSIVLALRRKLPTEHVERLRHADESAFHTFARKLARLALDFGHRVAAARPDLPPALNDRAQDNWEPLLAVADACGGRWPERARAAAISLSCVGQEAAPSTSAELLADIRQVFGSKGADKLSTTELIQGLCSDEERPWATYNRGKEITPKQLAGKLREYGIASKNLAFGAFNRPKGYELSLFADTFERYLPPPINQFGPTDATSSNSAGFEVAAGTSVAATKNLPLPQEPHDFPKVASSSRSALPAASIVVERFDGRE